MTTSELDNRLESFLKRFPNNAKHWSEATDEIMDLCHQVRTTYNELVLDVIEGEEGYIESLNWREMKSPSQWNTEFKNMILNLWPKMTDWAKENITILN